MLMSKPMPTWARILCHIVTFNLVAAIVVSAIVLFARETVPTMVPEIQNSTVFDRAQKYD